MQIFRHKSFNLMPFFGNPLCQCTFLRLFSVLRSSTISYVISLSIIFVRLCRDYLEPFPSLHRANPRQYLRHHRAIHEPSLYFYRPPPRLFACVLYFVMSKLSKCLFHFCSGISGIIGIFPHSSSVCVFNFCRVALVVLVVFSQ